VIEKRTIHEITPNRTNKTSSLRVFSWIVSAGRAAISQYMTLPKKGKHRFALLLLLLCFLSNVAVLHAQVNRRAAMDHLNRGTRELDAGDLEGALAEFNRAIALTPTTLRHISVAVWYGDVRRITTAPSAISPKRSSSILLPRHTSTAALREKTRATVMER